jgi:hypothetical protein
MAACPQALAVYGDAQRRAPRSPLPDRPARLTRMLHRFSLSFAESGVKMDGVVMLAGEPDRPWGVIMHNCPQGDATGAEIAACTVWQGPVYAISVEGAVSWIPARDAMRTAGERPAAARFRRGGDAVGKHGGRRDHHASRRCFRPQSLSGMNSIIRTRP